MAATESRMCGIQAVGISFYGCFAVLDARLENLSSNRGQVRLRQKDDEVEWYNLLKESECLAIRFLVSTTVIFRTPLESGHDQLGIEFHGP